MGPVLTPKNRQAIDWYLSADPECGGNGTKSWQRVYGTQNAASARASWARLLEKDSALAYKERRLQELEDKRAELIVYGQAEAMRDLLNVQQDAMQPVSHGKVVRKKRYRDKATGEERVEIEYDDVIGMMDHKAAIDATVEAIRIQGKHPDQRSQGAGVAVNIQIDTHWRGNPNAPGPIEVTETPDELLESGEEPPRAMIIGRK